MTRPEATRPGIVRRRLVMTVAALAAGTGVALWMWRSERTAAPPVAKEAPVANTTQPLPIPALSETPYLNANPDARYIGTAACASCHRESHQSYRLTPHSRSFSELNLETEPPDGAFDHPASSRSYRVYRRTGQFHHEETIRASNGREISRADLPVRYLIGSGHHTRSYLVEADGFLYESPVTWYSSRQRWDVSPGYDTAHPRGFERPVALECVSCHSGRAEEVDGAYHRLKFQEYAIGCENCHGPGSLHRDRYASGRPPGPAEPDRTIVNPGKLSRTLQESICASCHLSTTMLVTVRGREPGDFRPGRPLSDFRVHYRFAAGDEAMSVVGHVEQLRRSSCYQASPGLSCVTCHDPHHAAPATDRITFYRQKCLDCHARRPCKLAADERSRKQDDCIACHMPRGDTEIPHIAFTHHRIGRHGAVPARRTAAVSDLIADGDASHLDELDRQRCLGLAYYQLSRSSIYELYTETFRWNARKLLEDALQGGIRDPDVLVSLAALVANADPDRASRLARLALDQPISPRERTRALSVLFDRDFQDRNYAGAIVLLQELTRLRRTADDWRFMGMCHQQLNDAPKALAAFQKALAIRPDSAVIHAQLEQLYRLQGDMALAAAHRDKAVWLQSRQGSGDRAPGPGNQGTGK